MNVIVRLFGVDPNAENANVTEEEIRMMVDVGKEKGTIQDIEKVMINNIFEFDNKTVSDIMTHRTNIVAIPIEYGLHETARIVNLEKYTRFPVYEDNIDHIIGILHVKDLIQFIEDCDETKFNLRELIRDPFYILESIRIDHLFREMQEHNLHMAIAVDEYGGTDGIVSIEDLIEEIVGNIFDEHDEIDYDDEEIIELDSNTYLFPGTTNLYEVEDILKVELPTQDYDTLSGFVIGQLGYIPIGDQQPFIEYQNITFEVDEMNELRIMKVKVTVKAVEVEVD
jgi:putative hemolysin